MAVRQDELAVRTFTDRSGDRVVIDFDLDPGTDRFMVITPEGAAICIGAARVTLGWDAVSQLTDVLILARKTIQHR